MTNQNTELIETPSKLKTLDTVSDLLDSRFRIPGTDTRFGIDFLVGLIPYAGDIITFGMSGLLVIAMVRNGASGMVLAKMLGNIFLDTTVGSVPILGDIFDLKYKSNRRNYALLKEHYEEGKHDGSIWPIVLLVLALLIGMFVLLIWVIWKLADLTWGALFG
jgi:hypothetical protein